MKPVIARIDEIKKALDGIDAIQVVAEGFDAYSAGKVDVPDPGELLFEDPSEGSRRKRSSRECKPGTVVSTLAY